MPSRIVKSIRAMIHYHPLDLIIRRVGLGSRRSLWVSGQKMMPHARLMTWSGRIRFGLGRVDPHFVCNFRVGSEFFLKFRIKYFSLYPTRHLIGSDRVGIFSGELGQIYRIGWPVIVTPKNLASETVHSSYLIFGAKRN